MARLDVREDLRHGRPPLGRITDAVEQLAPDETLVLVTPFEPVPMISLMRGNGYSHVSRQIAASHWETVFTPQTLSARHAGNQPGRQPHVPAGPGPLLDEEQAGDEDIREIDARGLEPPEPMVRILSALAELPEGMVLRAFTDRRPIHLLDAVIARGFRAECFEQSARGSWVTDIRHA